MSWASLTWLPPQQDVLADVAVKEHHVLRHVADLAAQALGFELADGHPSTITAPWSGP